MHTEIHPCFFFLTSQAVYDFIISVTLTQACKQVITKFYKAIGDAEWRRNIKEFVISRIESLVESLPILAKSGRESELSSAMGLITGYLDIMGGKGSPNSVPSKKEGTHKKRSKCSPDVLSKFLSHKLVENPLRQCLVGEFSFSCQFFLYIHHVLVR